MKASKPWIVLATVFALLVITSAALAAEGDDDENTVFNFGYDTENQVFVWGASTDAALDCRLMGTYEVKYVTIEGKFWVDDLLTESAEQVTFPVNDDPAAEPQPYTTDGECALSAGLVSGPNGQINHGMFMKLFNSLYAGPGRGCLVRHLAQSDLGKGDQQVRVPDVGDEVLTEPESGTIDIENALARCNQADDDDLESESNGKGRPDHAGKGKPPWAGQPGGPKGQPGG